MGGRVRMPQSMFKGYLGRRLVTVDPVGCDANY